MVVKIYGFNISALLVCKELGIEYEYIPVKMKDGEHKSAHWIENMHPFGQIPVIIDADGFQMHEGRAIGRYLAVKYKPNTLVPSPEKDVQKYARFEQAMSIENNDFSNYIVAVQTERILKPGRGEATHEAFVQENLKNLEEKLQGYERILSKNKYLAGDEITFADLVHLQHGCQLEFIYEINLLNDSNKLPNVARWWNSLKGRESWKEVKEDLRAYVAAAGMTLND